MLTNVSMTHFHFFKLAKGLRSGRTSPAFVLGITANWLVANAGVAEVKLVRRWEELRDEAWKLNQERLCNENHSRG